MRKVIKAAAILLLIGSGLTACSTTPQIVTKTVEMPVPVHCTPKLSPKPIFPDTARNLRKQKNIFGRTKLLLAGRKLRDARILELKVAVDGCG